MLHNCVINQIVLISPQGTYLQIIIKQFLELFVEINLILFQQLSWPSPQKAGGYDFATTEQLAKHIGELN